MKKRIISLLITLSLIMAVMNMNVIAEKKPEISEEPSISVSVIDDALMKVLENTDESELIAVDIWFDEVDSSVIEASVKSKDGINRESIRTLIESGEDASLSSEIVDEYIQTARNMYSEQQLLQHNKFISDYEDLVNLQKAQKGETAFISEFSPLISVS